MGMEMGCLVNDCPHCGRCRTCGRRDAQPAPVVPWPVSPFTPTLPYIGDPPGPLGGSTGCPGFAPYTVTEITSGIGVPTFTVGNDDGFFTVG